MSEVKTKTCSKCGETKELSEFYNMKTGTHGKDTYCKDCRKKVNQKYEKDNRQRRNEYRNQYYYKNREAILERMKRDRNANSS